MKYFLRSLLLFAIFFFLLIPLAHAEENASNTFPYNSSFVVTGYYSPLPDQTRYATGTYEGDIRLNGEGVHAADGTVVFSGMFAAPPDVPFGTKIFIPGIGLGEVHDRGGAIKVNRLDVWMGYGEEGLRRALSYGIREVTATIYGKDPSKAIEVDLSKLPLAKDIGLFVRTKYFRHDLTIGDQGAEVEELQRLLKQLSYYQGEIIGFYGEETKRAMLQFQIGNALLNDEDTFGAGHFGPRSRAKFESVLLSKAQEAVMPSRSLKKGDEGGDVFLVQKVLVTLGFPNEADGKFLEQTFNAVYQFQRKQGIVLRKDDYGAGIIGPRTKDELQKAFRAYWTPDASKLEIPERFQSSKQPLIIFRDAIALGDRGEDVTALQEELRRLHFLRVEPTGYFGKVTEHAVFKFQQATGIVDKEKDPGAGLVGPKTREKLHGLIVKREEQNRFIVEKTERVKSTAAAEQQEKKLLAETDTPYSNLIAASLFYGDTNENVRSLQTFLRNLGYFEGRITTDYFGDLTRESLIQFQLKHGLIESRRDSSAGKFNEQTKSTISKLARG